MVAAVLASSSGGSSPVHTRATDRAKPADAKAPDADAGSPPPPVTNGQAAKASQLYIHAPRGRAGRSIDDSTEHSVEATRMGGSA